MTNVVRKKPRLPTKTVYFVRHGESEANVGTVFQPVDSPLSDEGRAQAKKVAQRASHLKFDLLVASPLPRARDTAAYIAEATDIQPIFSELFVEYIKPTGISGLPYTDERASRLWWRWQESLFTPGLRVDDGENFDDQILRADRALNFLHARPETNILVVTHGWFLRTIFARVLLGPTLTGPAFRHLQSHAEMENTGISVIQYGEWFLGEGWRMWTYNDHAHLGE